MEAISHAGTCLGILASDGIVIAAEKKNVHKLLDDTVSFFLSEGAIFTWSHLIRFNTTTDT